MKCQCGAMGNAPTTCGMNAEGHHVVHDDVKCHTSDRCTLDLHCPFFRTDVGRKDDALKTRYDLLPWRALGLVAQVLTKGAEKYAPENWRKVEGWRWRYFRAAIGHLAKWRTGEKLDPEWGLPHLAHAACCVLFMLELDE